MDTRQTNNMPTNILNLDAQFKDHFPTAEQLNALLHDNIHILSFKNNTLSTHLSVADIHDFFAALENSNIHTLYFSNTALTFLNQKKIEAFVGAIKKTSITDLHLDGCKIGTLFLHEFKSLLKIIMDTDSKISRLDLSNNELFTFGIKGLNGLQIAAHNNGALKSINLSQNCYEYFAPSTYQYCKNADVIALNMEKQYFNAPSSSTRQIREPMMSALMKSGHCFCNLTNKNNIEQSAACFQKGNPPIFYNDALSGVLVVDRIRDKISKDIQMHNNDSLKKLSLFSVYNNAELMQKKNVLPSDLIEELNQIESATFAPW